MIKVNVHFYAQLKDFFGDSLELQLSGAPTIQTLFDALQTRNALASEWLRVSRAAGEDAFLPADFELSENGRYYILPPSSGG